MPPRVLLILLLCLLSLPAFAQQIPPAAFSKAQPLVETGRSAMIKVHIVPDQPTRQRPGASLFIGPQSGFFMPSPAPDRPVPELAPLAADASQTDRILHVIASAEASKSGYDSVQHGARIKPSKPPTKMTLAEIYDWIRSTPGQPHAIGRYQFIPPTLRRLAALAGYGPSTRFSPRVQDHLATLLLHEAGLRETRSGQLSRRDFMNNLAKIWAGLPNSSGRSHYHGYAGNRASITWERFEREMTRIFPS